MSTNNTTNHAPEDLLPSALIREIINATHYYGPDRIAGVPILRIPQGVIERALIALESHATLLAEREALVSVVKDLRKRHAQTVKEAGGCDHSVGICWCDDIRALDAADTALRDAAHIGS